MISQTKEASCQGFGLFAGGKSHYQWISPSGSIWFVPIQRDKLIASGQTFQATRKTRWALQLLKLGVPLGRVVGLERTTFDSLVKSISCQEISDCSCYIGTLGAYRKATLALWYEKSFSLLVKISLSPRADRLVEHEFNILSKLIEKDSDLPIPRVGKLLRWQDRSIFTMQPLPGRSSPLKLSQLHLDWCKRLFHVENDTHVWEDSPCRMELSTKINYLPTHIKSIFECSLGYLDSCLKSRELPFGWAQRDFAPWNTRLDDNRLIVFDWENAVRTRPPGYDILHFDSIQLALKSKSFRAPLSFLKVFLRDTSPEWLGHERAIYLLYFLDQALFYFEAQQEFSQGSSKVLDWMLDQMKTLIHDLA